MPSLRRASFAPTGLASATGQSSRRHDCLVIAFSLSSTLVKRAESPGVLVAFWRMVTVSVVWNLVLWSTGRRITMENVRQVYVPGVFFGLNLLRVYGVLDREWRAHRNVGGQAPSGAAPTTP